MSGPVLRLVTIPISHYCEKARWALDRAGIRYRERAHLQVIHRFVVRRAGGGTTAPVLICGDTVLADAAVAAVGRFTGIDTNGFSPTPVRSGILRVKLKPLGSRAAFDRIADRLRDRIGAAGSIL